MINSAILPGRVSYKGNNPHLASPLRRERGKNNQGNIPNSRELRTRPVSTQPWSECVHAPPLKFGK